jgi:hypothetical protein
MQSDGLSLQVFEILSDFFWLYAFCKSVRGCRIDAGLTYSRRLLQMTALCLAPSNAAASI